MSHERIALPTEIQVNYIWKGEHIYENKMVISRSHFPIMMALVPVSHWLIQILHIMGIRVLKMNSTRLQESYIRFYYKNGGFISEIRRNKDIYLTFD